MNIFEKICDWDNLNLALDKTLKSEGKFKNPAIEFCSNRTTNLRSLQYSLLNGYYEFGRYNKFYVFEPKKRVIYAPNFRDKVVHHAINNILRDIYEPVFMDTSFACIRGKGHKRAVNKIQHDLRVAKRNYDTPYCLKMDVSKFFYNIDREKLKTILRKKIKDHRTLLLLDMLIDSSPECKGLPLGNLTSQLFANVYMNHLDQYIKRRLQVKHYVRYADDLFLVLSDKKQAKECSKRIRKFILNELRLNIPLRKVRVHPLRMGMVALGFLIYPTHIKIPRKKWLRFRKILNNRNTESMSSSLVSLQVGCWKNMLVRELARSNELIWIPNQNKIYRGDK